MFGFESTIESVQCRPYYRCINKLTLRILCPAASVTGVPIAAKTKRKTKYLCYDFLTMCDRSSCRFSVQVNGYVMLYKCTRYRLVIPLIIDTS